MLSHNISSFHESFTYLKPEPPHMYALCAFSFTILALTSCEAAYTWDLFCTPKQFWQMCMHIHICTHAFNDGSSANRSRMLPAHYRGNNLEESHVFAVVLFGCNHYTPQLSQPLRFLSLSLSSLCVVGRVCLGKLMGDRVEKN